MKSAHPPGPTSPAMVQSWRWMRNPPLGLLEEHHRRYGDVFRLEILGPKYRRDRTRWPLARRTVVVFSAPDAVQEIFSQSDDTLRAGEAQEFLEWFLGPRSLMVLDGAAHRAEKRELLSLFTPERIDGFERALQRAAVRSLEGWPAGAAVDLAPLIDRALEEMNRELVFGSQQIDQRKLELTRRARNAFSSPLLFVPLLRADLGTWSAGGIVAEIRRGVRQVVAERVGNHPIPAAESEPSLLTLLVQLQSRNGTNEDGLDLLVDRTLTLLGGLDNASAAVLWTCHHLVRNPEVLAHAQDEVRRLPAAAVAGPDSYLEAVCKESLRLHPVFPVVVRRVARPVSLAGYDLAPGTFVMASMYLLHRRADLYPDPEAFQPDRFLGRFPRTVGYAPFGTGVRRCLGSALASRQMRVLLTEMLRRFEVTPRALGTLIESRRNVTVVPAGPLPVTLRRVGLEAISPIPGPGHSAPLQTLIALVGSISLADQYRQRYPDLFRVRLLMPRQPGHPSRWPLVEGSVVIVSSPELLREVFTTAGPALLGGEARRFTEWFFGTQSLFVLDGAEHREERRGLLSLLTPDHRARVERVTRDVATTALAELPESGEVELGPVFDEAVFESSVRLMFGSVDDSIVARLRDCIRGGLTSLGWSGLVLLFPWLQRDLGPWSPGGRARRVLAGFRELLAAAVEQHRTGAVAQDVWLSDLLALESGAVETSELLDRRASRVLAMFGTMQTTAVALRWCLYHLLRNPEVLDRATRASRAGEESYLEAVCKETARIHPPIPILSRYVAQPVLLGGRFRLEPGSYLVGSIYFAHHRPDLYPEPDRFRPERFLERSFSPYEFLPFGGGAHRCIGHGLGFRQMSVVLGELLKAFDLTVHRLPRLRVRRNAVTMVPTDPLRVSLRRS